MEQNLTMVDADENCRLLPEFHNSFIDEDGYDLSFMERAFEAVQWLAEIKLYFDVYEVPEDKKVILAASCLKKAACEWLLVQMKMNEDFLKLSHPYLGFEVDKFLCHLKPGQTMKSYQREFSAFLFFTLPDSVEIVTIARYLSGIEQTMREEIIAAKPKSLASVFTISQDVYKRHLHKRDYTDDCISNLNYVSHRPTLKKNYRNASGVYENKAPELVMSVVNTKHACDLLVDFAFTTEVFITTIIDNIDIKIRTFQVDNSRTAEIFKNNYWCY
ncbi:hypothetical protein JL09_g3664 [Pichia kudriavzevii]|uniref:Retrotransposon gag domain-containing protein n=1 Tax=Pichia kudriavzevii TaxID=4909 RepID=A0A099NX69_PICKU|nr:hypothetical protein JL09_g3664 [Pichia kudriavzevii]